MSSLKDLASLIMIPSLYKDGRLDTVKPLGNSIIHPDATGNNDGTDGSTPAEGNFTFSRGSNLAATRVDVNGLIEKGRENLILQSNNFSSGSWSAAPYVTSTGGQQGYDGTNDAWELEVAVSGNYRSLTQASNTSGVVTNSIYAKAGNSNYLGIVDTAGQGSSICIFDLTDGSISYQGGGDFIETSSESIGNGWYRLKTTHKGVSPNYMLWFVANAGNSTGGTIGNSVFIQDAQQEQGLVATDYIETGASTAQAGILEDMPRLDYSGGASCPSLLLEPQRSNALADSEYFGGSYYAKGSGVSVVDNNYTSPEGLVNGAKLVGATGTDRNGSVIGRIVSVSSSTTYTASIYVYRDTATQCTLYLRDGSTGVILSKSVTLESGWQRIDKSLTTGASTSQMNLYLGNTDGDIGIYGIQVEVGSYPTSYIPTYGTSQTRSEDFNYLLNVQPLIGQTQGTMFLEVQGLENGGFSRRFTISDGTSNNRVAIELDEIASRIRSYIVGSGANDGNLDIDGINQTINLKIAVTYNGSELKMSVNGSTPSSLSTSVVTSGMNRMQFSTAGSSTNKMYGKVKQALVFPTALTDSECIALTTL